MAAGASAPRSSSCSAASWRPWDPPRVAAGPRGGTVRRGRTTRTDHRPIPESARETRRRRSTIGPRGRGANAVSKIFDDPVLHIKKLPGEACPASSTSTSGSRRAGAGHRPRTQAAHLEVAFRNAVGAEYSGRHFMHVDGLTASRCSPSTSTMSCAERGEIQQPNTGEIGRLNKVSRNPVKPHFQIADPRATLSPISLSFRRAHPRTPGTSGARSTGRRDREILRTDPRTLRAMPGLNGHSTLRTRSSFRKYVRVLLVAAFVDDCRGSKKRISLRSTRKLTGE